jgi:predicted signal transduction protein with EAL and GGDEF domain
MPGRSDSLVAAIVAMARRLGMALVAEGIELPRQLVALRAMGCDEGQGHLLAPAMPPAALARHPRYGSPAPGATGRPASAIDEAPGLEALSSMRPAHEPGHAASGTLAAN